jgi:hypothetical protein
VERTSQQTAACLWGWVAKLTEGQKSAKSLMPRSASVEHVSAPVQEQTSLSTVVGASGGIDEH